MKDKLKRHAAVMFTALSLTIVNVRIAKAQNSTPWLAPKDLANTANPTKPNEITLKDSKKLYNNTCGPCHGDKGKGDGAAAIACNPKPADHTSSALLFIGKYQQAVALCLPIKAFLQKVKNGNLLII